jgi:hypothetical protein
VSASADVPASTAPPPQLFTLEGVVSDDRTAAPIAGATVQTVGGSSSGKTSSTDASGHYVLSGLTSGSITVRVTANGYDALEQNVTIAANATADLKLRATAAPQPPSPPPPATCGFTLGPPSNSVTWQGGTFSVSIASTSGNCAWQATSNVSWITFVGSASVTGSGTLTYVIAVNGGVTSTNTRFGAVNISWSGGSATHSVDQGGASPELCRFTLSAGGSDRVSAPSAGGQFSATVTWVNTGIPPSVCTGTASSDASWITFVPPTPAPLFGSGGGTLTFTVAPNPSPGTTRSASVSIRSSVGPSSPVSITVTQQ